MNEKFIKNEREMLEFGKNFAKNLRNGSILFLNGELGTGKTTFVKGLGLGLGIDKNKIKSPSFLIIHNYGKLIHIDLYRIQNASAEELEEAGIIEALNSKRIKAVEWPSKILEMLYPEAIIINFYFKGEGRYVRWKI